MYVCICVFHSGKFLLYPGNPRHCETHVVLLVRNFVKGETFILTTRYKKFSSATSYPTHHVIRGLAFVSVTAKRGRVALLFHCQKGVATHSSPGDPRSSSLLLILPFPRFLGQRARLSLSLTPCFLPSFCSFLSSPPFSCPPTSFSFFLPFIFLPSSFFLLFFK